MNKLILFLSFILSSIIIFLSYFTLENNTLEIMKISNNVENNLYFIYNPKDTNASRDTNDQALYIFSYINIGEEKYNKVILNRKALEYKLPYFFGQSIAQFEFDSNLDDNILYTNHKEFSNLATYKYYFKPVSIHNALFEIDVNIDFIEIKDNIEFENASFAIQKNNGQYDNFSELNNIFTNRFICNSKGLKDNINYQYNLFNNVIMMVTFVPIIIFIIIILNSINLYIKANKMDIIVNNIYNTKTKKKHILLLLISSFSLIYLFSYIILGLIFDINKTNICFFFISYFVILILIFINSSKLYEDLCQKGLKEIYA